MCVCMCVNLSAVRMELLTSDQRLGGDGDAFRFPSSGGENPGFFPLVCVCVRCLLQSEFLRSFWSCCGIDGGSFSSSSSSLQRGSGGPLPGLSEEEVLTSLRQQEVKLLRADP